MRWALVVVMLWIGGPVWAGPTEDMMAVFNAYRAKIGRGPVVVSPELTMAARMHAEDMQRSGFLSHTGSDGSDIAARAGRAGYRFCFLAENILTGSGSSAARNAGQAFEIWLGSRGHRRNMRDRRVGEFGVAQVGGYWVLVMGRQSGARGC